MILGRQEETERSHIVFFIYMNFFQKSFSWEEEEGVVLLMNKFMRGKFKSCSLVCRWRSGELV